MSSTPPRTLARIAGVFWILSLPSPALATP
jgi:hypothetical protein